MKIPHTIFEYDREKDIENILIGLNVARQGRWPDRELAQIIKLYGNTPTKKELELYLNSRWEKKEHILLIIVKQLQEYWDAVEESYFNHLADRMQLTSYYGIEQLSGFLSTRYGSGYNFNEHWFAVSVHNGTLQNTRVAMHEIMHIFFHKQWWNFCLEQGVSAKNVWDIKESTTVLLNLWFKDQLIDIDWGYEEHAELRYLIKECFLKTRDFKKTLKEACEFMKINPQKSPIWITK